MLRTTVPALALGVAALVALTGCAAPSSTPQQSPTVTGDPSVPLAQLDILDDPRSYEGPSTAVLETEAVVAGATPEQELPASVVSHDLSGDTDVTVDSTERIIAMDIAGSIASTLVALGLGDNLVGRDISTTVPELAELPVITSSGHTVNNEAILALRPDVLITDGTVGPIDVVLQLREAGIAVVFVDTEPSMDGASELARQVAAALGVVPTGEVLADSLSASIAAKSA